MITVWYAYILAFSTMPDKGTGRSSSWRSMGRPGNHLEFNARREKRDVCREIAKDGVVDVFDGQELDRNAMLVLGLKFVEVGKALRVSGLDSGLGVDWSFGDFGEALTFGVVALARSVLPSFVAAVRLKVLFLASICAIFPCHALRRKGMGLRQSTSQYFCLSQPGSTRKFGVSPFWIALV